MLVAGSNPARWNVVNFVKMLAELLIIVVNNLYLHVFFIILYRTIIDSSGGKAGECSLLVRSDICWSLVQPGAVECGVFHKILAVLLLIVLNNL